MTVRPGRNPEWREFERLIARIERDAGPLGLVIKSPDRLRCKITGRLREVDASVRAKVGTTEMLVTIECRHRSKLQDVTWIEQLATKKSSIGADRTIAVSSSGFSADAGIAASHAGISLRKIADLTVKDINPILGIDLVMFWHKECAFLGAGIRKFYVTDNKTPEPEDIEYIIPPDTDPFLQIFHNEDGSSWSLNEIWHEIQSSLNPYATIAKGEFPITRTARISYPGTVHIETPQGRWKLGHVFLSVTMWIEPEMVPIEDALKVSYSDPNGHSIHRVEFSSLRTKDWRISLQAQSDSKDINEIRVGGNRPENK